MSNVKDRVVDIIAEVLSLDAEGRAVLNDDTGNLELGSWTSARHAEIIVALEDEFDREVEERMIARLSDVPKIVDYFDRAA